MLGRILVGVNSGMTYHAKSQFTGFAKASDAKDSSGVTLGPTPYNAQYPY